MSPHAAVVASILNSSASVVHLIGHYLHEADCFDEASASDQSDESDEITVADEDEAMEELKILTEQDKRSR